MEEKWEYLLGKHQVFDNLHVHLSSIAMSAEEAVDKVFIPRESIPMDFGLLYVHLCMSCYKNVKYKIHSVAFLTPPPPSFLILEEELKELPFPISAFSFSETDLIIVVGLIYSPYVMIDFIFIQSS